MAKPKITRTSLAQHFAAPDGYVGEFGWLCGYSADAVFMRIAAERFSTENASARGKHGCIRLGLLLDQGNPQLSTVAVPGVMHFPVKGADAPFVLLHAKVAVLGFRRLDDPNDWRLRLLVSTGNWTRATLEDTIDLAWRVDIDSGATDDGARRDCADLAAAWSMLARLRGFFDTSILDALPAGRGDTDTQLAQLKLEDWVAQAAKRARGQPRFIDNWGRSLWVQVQSKVKGVRHVSRNYLAMGSAYFQGASGAGAPSVLQTVVNDLRGESLLTDSVTVDLYVNPEACQAVAPAAQAIAAQGWTVRPPRKLAGQSFMHAKFIFSANFREKSNRCTSAWLYFGSGNLTGPGLLKKASASGGNLEAGVVLTAEHMLWAQTADDAAASVLENLLPLQWTQEAATAQPLQQGEQMDVREANWVAPPLTYLLWQGDGAGAGSLAAPHAPGAQFDVLDSGDRACLRDAATAHYRWAGARPAQVTVRWSADGTQRAAAVPVIDEQGGVATAVAGAVALEQALWELGSFPARANEDDADDTGVAELEPESMDKVAAGRAGVLQYPIRLMMQQLDAIAELQCKVEPLDWRIWCNRLEQVLCRAGESAEVVAFRALGIDPLSALRAAAFRPQYAESGQSVEGRRYEAALDRIALAWKVNGLASLGEQQ